MKIERKKGAKGFKIVDHNRYVFWAIVVLSILLIFVLISINKSAKIVDFDSCVAAGNPVMESYPRQCKNPVNDLTYIEIVGDFWKYDSIELLRHNETGEYGCFGCSGPNVKTPMCVDPISEMRLVEETENRYCDSDFNIIEMPIIGGNTDEHGCLIAAGYSYNESLGGCVREWESEKQVYCTEESRTGDACIELYAPVCGWNNPEKIQCIKYPCAETYSNSCFACLDEKVEYYTEGECPK